MKSSQKLGPATRRLQILRLAEVQERDERQLIEAAILAEGISTMLLEDGNFMQIPPQPGQFINQ